MDMMPSCKSQRFTRIGGEAPIRLFEWLERAYANRDPGVFDVTRAPGDFCRV